MAFSSGANKLPLLPFRLPIIVGEPQKMRNVIALTNRDALPSSAGTSASLTTTPSPRCDGWMCTSERTILLLQGQKFFQIVHEILSHTGSEYSGAPDSSRFCSTEIRQMPVRKRVWKYNGPHPANGADLRGNNSHGTHADHDFAAGRRLSLSSWLWPFLQRKFPNRSSPLPAVARRQSDGATLPNKLQRTGELHVLDRITTKKQKLLKATSVGSASAIEP